MSGDHNQYQKGKSYVDDFECPRCGHCCQADQPTQQEPVAWITDGGKGELWWHRSSKFDEEGNLIGPNPDDIPLYTAPPKREWVGLTDEELKPLCDENHIMFGAYTVDFIQAIEAKLKEKNT